jgi:hypothetical protein
VTKNELDVPKGWWICSNCGYKFKAILNPGDGYCKKCDTYYVVHRYDSLTPEKYKNYPEYIPAIFSEKFGMVMDKLLWILMIFVIVYYVVKTGNFEYLIFLIAPILGLIHLIILDKESADIKKEMSIVTINEDEKDTPFRCENCNAIAENAGDFTCPRCKNRYVFDNEGKIIKELCSECGKVISDRTKKDEFGVLHIVGEVAYCSECQEIASRREEIKQLNQEKKKIKDRLKELEFGYSDLDYV